ncbi:UNKNOWN [Stylonychia lemnae]|uniref:Uncharacterized protein n=1 Tax=Stylonychia lemnae TaxID=5949 RepID=A0A078AW82_STYLE|nr:UNKNOWN [Stylonychia lemnae]|eukprot:CDW85058.1 UNKNOWN [Stylonychia lemnae]
MLRGYISNYLQKRSIIDIENTSKTQKNDQLSKSLIDTQLRRLNFKPNNKKLSGNFTQSKFRNQAKEDKSIEMNATNKIDNDKLNSPYQNITQDIEQESREQLFSKAFKIRHNKRFQSFRKTVQEEIQRNSPKNQNNQLKSKYSLERLSNNDFQVVMSMKNELIQMRKTFGNKISEKFLDNIEERLIVFMEDGSDLRNMKIGITEGDDIFEQYLQQTNNQEKKLSIEEDNSVIKWKKHPKQVVLNVNKYIAKYNFEIARKLSGEYYTETKENNRQLMFDLKALQELLQDVSNTISGGKKVYNSLFTVNGKFIKDLKSIPSDCRLVLCSNAEIQQQILEEDKSAKNYQEPKQTFQGIKGNIYHFESLDQNHQFESKRIRRHINQSKDRWFYQNLNNWNHITPGIQSHHKLEDLNLHFKDDSETRISKNQIQSNHQQAMDKLNNLSMNRIKTASLMSREEQKARNSHGNTYYNKGPDGQVNHFSNFSILTGNHAYNSQLQFNHNKAQNFEPMRMENFFRKKEPYSSNVSMLSHPKQKKQIDQLNLLNLQMPEELEDEELNLKALNNNHYDQNQSIINENYIKSFMTEPFNQQIITPLSNQRQQSFGIQNHIQQKGILKLQSMKINPQFVSDFNNNPDFSPRSAMTRDKNNHIVQKLNLKSNSRINSNMNRKKTQSSMNKSFKTSNINDQYSSSNHHQKLTYKDIEMWSAKYDLSWKEIYELDSEFQSLLQIEKENKDKLLKRVQEMRFDPNINSGMIQNEMSMIPQVEQKIGDNEPGITLQTFKDYSKMFVGKHKEVRRNLIQAFGIDISNKNTKIVWEQYLQIKCFLQFFTLPKTELIKIWIKILDPNGIRHILRSRLLEFLEILARGTVTDEQTLVSREFAKNIVRVFEMEDCVSDNGNEILMEKVEDAFNTGIMDIEILNQVLRVDCLYVVKSRHYNYDI